MNEGKNLVGLNLNIDQDLIKESVEEIVRAGIVQALGDPSAIVKECVDRTINQKVDGEGRPRGYSSDTPYLQWLANKTVENTVRDCITKYIEEHSAEFEAEIIRQLDTEKFKKDTAAAFLQCLANQSTQYYKMPVHVTFEAPKDY